MPRWIMHVDVNDFRVLTGGLCYVICRVTKPMLTSLSPILKDSVRSEYIGTPGCPPSSGLCANRLNRLMSLNQCLLDTKPLHNFDEGAITTNW